MTTNGDETRSITVQIGQGGEARTIACLYYAPPDPADDICLVWMGGYRSDMTGTKAVELELLARRENIACLRFDYSGHGASGGVFADGTISRWLAEALGVLAHFNPRRMVILGSSMGAWIALRTVKELRKTGMGGQVAGLVLIAPAPDFTSALIEPKLTETQIQDLATRGYFEEISEYGPEPNIYTRALIEDGRDNLVMGGIIETGCPVHILQGMADPDVPHSRALALMQHLPADDVVMTLIRDGDHRLSRPRDIAKICQAVTAMIRPA